MVEHRTFNPQVDGSSPSGFTKFIRNKMQNWPTRYKCNKCSRVTSGYPWGCWNTGCPIKLNVISDKISKILISIITLAIFLFLLFALHHFQQSRVDYMQF